MSSGMRDTYGGRMFGAQKGHPTGPPPEYDDAVDEVSRLRARIEALEEALREIVEAYGSENLIGNDFRKFAWNTARDALSTTEPRGWDSHDWPQGLDDRLRPLPCQRCGVMSDDPEAGTPCKEEAP